MTIHAPWDTPCSTCGEIRLENDPGLHYSNGKFICVFCGYWGVPPGPDRDKLRAGRSSELETRERTFFVQMCSLEDKLRADTNSLSELEAAVRTAREQWHAARLALTNERTQASLAAERKSEQQ